MERKAAFAALFVFLCLAACASLSSPVASEPRLEHIDKAVVPEATVVENKQYAALEFAGDKIVYQPVERKIDIAESTTFFPTRPVASPKAPYLLRLRDHPDFTIWAVWQETKWYREHYRFTDFKRLVARLNNIPDREYFFRRIGPASFPAGGIFLPPLPVGRPFDHKQTVARKIKTPVKVPADSSRPAPVPVQSISPAEAKIDRIAANQTAITERQLSLAETMRAFDQKTVEALARFNLSLARSTADTQNILRGVEDNLKLLLAQVTELSKEMQKLGAKASREPLPSRIIVPKQAPQTTPVGGQAEDKTVKAKSNWALFFGFLTLTIAAACGLCLLAIRQERNRLRYCREQLAVRTNELERIAAAISDDLTEFTVPAALMSEIAGLPIGSRLIYLLRVSGTNSLVPPCQGNPVLKKNMRGHITNCPTCRTILASRVEHRHTPENLETAVAA